MCRQSPGQNNGYTTILGAEPVYLHSMLDDSLSIVRFELGQLGQLLFLIDRGIASDSTSLRQEIEGLHAKGIGTNDQNDAADLIAIDDLRRYENYVGIVMAFVVYERFLMETLNIADREIEGLYVEKEKQLRRWNYG
jgi:hypothetical protein